TAGEALSHLGEPFRASFQGLLNRVFMVSGRKTEAVSIPIVIKTPEASANGMFDDYMKVISACLQEKRSVGIKYRSHSTKEITERIVDPYGLVFYDGTWILIGYCHLRKDIRSFALDRILALKERWLYFEPKEDFSLEEYLSGGWGVVQGEKQTGVTVRFGPAIADYILRKERWHSSEKRKIHKDGTVELSFVVAGVNEIRRWICSWLPDVEVIEPSWLRKQLYEELSRAAEQHR
ncbi:MAG TPA: WYL domain-containing protein, partial [Syntrophorhabdaceae bacterium]|nr:WYL domain-containing protein [Syntrophorhabdaceae bacterium]